MIASGKEVLAIVRAEAPDKCVRSPEAQMTGLLMLPRSPMNDGNVLEGKIHTYV